MTRTQAVAEKHDEESTRQYELGGKDMGALFAAELIERSGIAQSSQEPLVIFDNACGTGAVSSTLHKTLEDDTTRNWQLTCGDISEAMVEATKQKMNEEGWWNVEVKVVDAQDTRLPSAHYTHIFSALAFNFLPDSQAALNECFRVLQPGGILAVSTARSAIWVNLIQSAIARISGDLPNPTPDDVFNVYNSSWANETSIRTQFEQAGFVDINIITVPKQYIGPLQNLIEFCKVSLPHSTKLWTQQQRDMYYNEVPKMALRILEEKVGKDGLTLIGGEAVITTARKP